MGGQRLSENARELLCGRVHFSKKEEARMLGSVLMEKLVC